MSNLNPLLIPIYDGINDIPISPTDTQAPNGSYLISKYNTLISSLNTELNLKDTNVYLKNNNLTGNYINYNQYQNNLSVKVLNNKCFGINLPNDTNFINYTFYYYFYNSSLPIHFEQKGIIWFNNIDYIRPNETLNVPGQTFTVNGFNTSLITFEFSNTNIPKGDLDGTDVKFNIFIYNNLSERKLYFSNRTAYPALLYGNINSITP